MMNTNMSNKSHEGMNESSFKGIFAAKETIGSGSLKQFAGALKISLGAIKNSSKEVAIDIIGNILPIISGLINYSSTCNPINKDNELYGRVVKKNGN